LFYSAAKIFVHSGLKMLKRVVNTDHMVGLVAQETTWYVFFSPLCVTDRLFLDICYLFHVVPTDRGDNLALLFRNTVMKVHRPKHYDKASVGELICYSMAIDVLRLKFRLWSNVANSWQTSGPLLIFILKAFCI
jgi:hypothetical protein